VRQPFAVVGNGSSDTLFSTRGGWVKVPNHRQCKGRYTLSVKLSDLYCVTSYLTEKLSKLRSFDTQQCRPQNCPFQSSCTHRTPQFTQGITQFPQFTCRRHDVTRKRRHTQKWQKTDKPYEKTALFQRTFSSVFRAVFYRVKLHSL